MVSRLSQWMVVGLPAAGAPVGVDELAAGKATGPTEGSAGLGEVLAGSTTRVENWLAVR